jgi:hypothetical protein
MTPGPSSRRNGQVADAFVRLFAIAAPLAYGVASHRIVPGVLAAGGAFSVGFAGARRLRRSNLLLMLALSAGMAMSATLGTLAGHSIATLAFVAAAWGLVCGWVARQGLSAAWIALQCAIATLIATSYPSTLYVGATRALPVFLGGLLQAAWVTLFVRVSHRDREPPSPAPVLLDSPFVLATALVAASLLEKSLALRNGYWVPMTTLLVLRSENRETLYRAFGRLAGTIGGAALATALTLGLRPTPPMLIGLVAISAFGCYLLLRTNYGLYAVALTSYVVFLLSLFGLPAPVVVKARILGTAVGGAVALVVHAATRSWRAMRTLPASR